MAVATKKRKDHDIEAIISSTTCAHCECPLEEPWICCIACPQRLSICTRCFALGVEFGSHENNHPYTVVKFDFSLYEEDWTASEELSLLDAITEKGFGNWMAISLRMRTKTAAECECHYLTCYVEKPQPPLPEFENDPVVDHGAPIVFKLSDNPPRPPDGSSLSHDMGGYSAARGDFNIEFDNYFEMDICHMKIGDFDATVCNQETSDDEELFTELNLTVLDVYRNCLKERQSRKKFVRDYGLINMRKWYGMFKRRYERNMSFEFFRPFMRLFPPIVFDKYLESLFYEKQLKTDILKLQEYRQNGIKRLQTIQPYHIMKQRRERTQAKRHLLTDVLNHIKDENSAQTWLAHQAGLTTVTALPRKSAPRLNIENFPGFEKLSNAEKEMCSDVRLVPEAYLEFSKILKAECNKHGSLKLAQARNLIKIDVNKTRKLYDFMILQGHINKDPL